MRSKPQHPASSRRPPLRRLAGCAAFRRPIRCAGEGPTPGTVARRWPNPCASSASTPTPTTRRPRVRPRSPSTSTRASGATLVCCTGGEAGDILNPAMDRPEVRERLHEVRMDELAASVAAIGYDELVMLGYRDSGMPDTPENDDPRSFARADLDEAVGRLVEVIRRDRAQVILTYGDDQKGYPHPDHLRVHDISILAWDRAGDPDWYPDLGAPLDAEQALLLGLVAGSDHVDAREVPRDGPRVALRGQVVRASRPGRADHDPGADRPVRWRPPRRPAGPRHPDRSGVTVLVRPARRGAHLGVPLGGLAAGRLPGCRPSCPRTTCSPVCADPRPEPPEAPMPVTYLSDEWFAAAGDAFAALPERPGATATIQRVITGSPDGDVALPPDARGRSRRRRRAGDR